MQSQWQPIQIDRVQINSSLFRGRDGKVKGDDNDFDHIEDIRLRMYCDLGSDAICFMFQVCTDKASTFVKTRALMILQRYLRFKRL